MAGDELEKVLSSGLTVLLYRGGLEACAEGHEQLGLRALRQDLGSLGLDVDPSVPLSELVAGAAISFPSETKKAVTNHLVAKRIHDPEPITNVITGPFVNVYDISCTNLLESAATGLGLAVISAPSDPVSGSRQVVKMAELPRSEATASNLRAPISAEADSGRRNWYRRLRAEAQTSNVIVMADTLDDPDLWEYLSALRRYRPTMKTLVSTNGVPPLRLANLGMSHVELGPVDLARTRLSAARLDVDLGATKLARFTAEETSYPGVRILNPQLSTLTPGSSDFLRGYEPSFEDMRDIAAKLDVHTKVTSQIEQSDKTVVLHGPAGSGKTSTLMAAALRLAESGQVVGWIDRAADAPVGRMLDQLRELRPDVVLIDDADIFGDRVADLIEAAGSKGKRRVAISCRSSRMRYLSPQLDETEDVDVSARLSEEDAKKIVVALHAHGLLTRLRGFNPFPDAAANELLRISSGDLLAAMIQIVTGEKFDARISSELQQLDRISRVVYSAACMFQFTRAANVLSEVELIEICSQHNSPVDVVAAIDRLITDYQLLVSIQGGRYIAPRHHAIAERVIEILKAESQRFLAATTESLLTYYASIAHSIDDPSVPARRVLIRLLSHSLMLATGLPRDVVRKAYESVFEYLEADFHYWLQRAAYEADRGDLVKYAWPYIETARTCEGGSADFMVLTEWGSIVLRIATKEHDSQEWNDQAVEAINALERIARQKGGRSPHTFAVLARDGAAWLNRSTVLSPVDRRELAGFVIEIVKYGREVAGHNFEFLEQERRSRELLANLRSRAQEEGFPL